MSPKTQTLYSKNVAIEFYQDRYTHGYMDEWPAEKKQRVFEVIRNLPLPECGDALDFGCGNGVFTDVIRQALPTGWKISGSDISEVAVTNARKRYPECNFFSADDKEFVNKKFDLVFTHHVLEHVFNLQEVFAEIVDRLKKNAAMLHILPCGNPGSLEHQICLLRKGGINPDQENRFFFEDEGHVRRLTTDQMVNICSKYGFSLTEEFYSGQYFGAFNWVTQTGLEFVKTFTDPSNAVNELAANKIRNLRKKMIALWFLRFPACCLENKFRKTNKTIRDYILMFIGLPIYILTKPADFFLKKKALQEWNCRKTNRNGSEMYLFFHR
jgi:SAM-dependent methyltransferase